MRGMIITDVVLTNGQTLPLVLDSVTDPEDATETARTNIIRDGGIRGVANSTGALVFVPSASILFVASYYEESDSQSPAEEIPLPEEPPLWDDKYFWEYVSDLRDSVNSI